MSSKADSSSATIATVVVATIATVLIALVEIGAWPLGPKVYLTYGAAVSIILLWLVFWRFKAEKLVVWILFLLALCVLWITPWNSRKTFLRDFYSIRPGMTIAEVDARMKRYAKYNWSTGPSQRIYRHSNTDEYGADFDIVDFKNGKVTKTLFHPD